MKLIIDEKLKHRIIGVAVIISLGAIFAPAMMKKSSQNMENNYSVRVKLPSKPEEPNVAISDEKEVFKTIKIAKVDIPQVSAESQLPQLTKAEAIHSDKLNQPQTVSIDTSKEDKNLESIQLATLNKTAETTVKQASQTAVKHPILNAAPVRVVATANKAIKQTKKPSIVATKSKPQVLARVAPKPISRSPAFKADIYAVQLASFSQLSNAQALVSRLKTKGYKANFIKVASRNGVIYKVYAGHSSKKNDVIKLKAQLASAMQLNGFVVNTGVS